MRSNRAWLVKYANPFDGTSHFMSSVCVSVGYKKVISPYSGSMPRLLCFASSKRIRITLGRARSYLFAWRCISSWRGLWSNDGRVGWQRSIWRWEYSTAFDLAGPPKSPWCIWKSLLLLALWNPPRFQSSFAYLSWLAMLIKLRCMYKVFEGENVVGPVS